MRLHSVIAASITAALSFFGQNAAAAPYQDPPPLTSHAGKLDILMIAEQRTAVALGSVITNLWTYETCPLPSDGANDCAPGTGSVAYSGTRIAIQPGDRLHIRLINRLPPLSPADADHVADDPSLAGNPTNLHLHGLIVEPHRSVAPNDPYGDYVFVEDFNSHNSVGPAQVHPGIDVAEDAVEYVYDVGKDHPTGLFWYHPHIHGLSLNQVTAGLGGPLTIGNADEMCANLVCKSTVDKGAVRHLVLKDVQVAPGGVLKTQEEPNFCMGAPAGNRNGSCPGQRLDPSDPGADFRGGSWVHTVSGQVYPTIDVDPAGDIWRIVSVSGSRSYALSVVDSATHGPIPMQLLQIDGVTIGLSPNTDLTTLTTRLAGKATLVRCPGQSKAGLLGIVCVSTVNMMPSSRVSVRIVGPELGRPTQHAVFRTAAFATGDNGNGDLWPQIDLAAVTLPPRSPLTPQTIPLIDLTTRLFSSTRGLMGHAMLRIPSTMTEMPAERAGQSVATPSTRQATQQITLAPTVAVTPDQLDGTGSGPNCTPLAPGHHRKILFGYPTPTTFGLGYVEVDQNGHDIESTRIPITAFDPSKISVCVPLKGGNAVYEVWELQNLTNEDHNFHIHQTKFFRVAGGALPGQTIPQLLEGQTVLHDNMPVPRPANGTPCDGTLGQVKPGQCKPSKTFIVIPFSEVGDFVFHCHILEHEDGGMMDRIRVVAMP